MTRLRLIVMILFALIAVAFGIFIIHDLSSNESVTANPTEISSYDEPPSEPVVAEAEKPEPLDCTIGLYTGKGSWDVDLQAMRNFAAEYDLDCVDIDSKTINSADLNSLCDILVFVGGWSAEYRYSVENHANIRSFVEKGGCFLGFCAGAYYASTTMRWKGKPIEYPLKLFPAEAAGPLKLNWGSLSSVTLNKEIAFNEDFMDTMEMWYFDGPCFTGLPYHSTDILASYQTNDEAAVIAFDFGEGKVLLSGPHPELGFIPSSQLVQTEGGDGAQWSWLYAALQWLMDKKPV